jgi:hypothetical protein
MTELRLRAVLQEQEKLPGRQWLKAGAELLSWNGRLRCFRARSSRAEDRCRGGGRARQLQEPHCCPIVKVLPSASYLTKSLCQKVIVITTLEVSHCIEV